MNPDQNSQNKSKQLGNYELGKTLGEGAFSKVKRAVHKVTGELVAIKILEKEKIIDVQDVERVQRELHILKMIRHPSLIQLYEIIESPTHIFMVMEYCSNGEVFDYIVKHQRLAEDEASKLFQEIIAGIEYLHKLMVVHRDLKPENLLLDINNNVKIGDFGLSNMYKKNELLKTACGSPCYAAPEMIAGKRYESPKVDIWSSGVILFTLMCGFLPFEDNDTSKLYEKILKGKYSIPSHVSSDGRDLLEKILTVDPEKRVGFEDIKAHRWFNLHKRGFSIPPGVIVGYNQMPIDHDIVKELETEHQVDKNALLRSLDANNHDTLTTSYYLLLKKHIKQGGQSKADINSPSFDLTLIEPKKNIDSKHSHNYLNKLIRDVKNTSEKKRSSAAASQYVEDENSDPIISSKLSTDKKKKKISSIGSGSKSKADKDGMSSYSEKNLQNNQKKERLNPQGSYTQQQPLLNIPNNMNYFQQSIPQIPPQQEFINPMNGGQQNNLGQQVHLVRPKSYSLYENNYISVGGQLYQQMVPSIQPQQLFVNPQYQQLQPPILQQTTQIRQNGRRQPSESSNRSYQRQSQHSADPRFQNQLANQPMIQKKQGSRGQSCGTDSTGTSSTDFQQRFQSTAQYGKQNSRQIERNDLNVSIGARPSTTSGHIEKRKKISQNGIGGLTQQAVAGAPQQTQLNMNNSFSYAPVSQNIGFVPNSVTGGGFSSNSSFVGGMSQPLSIPGYFVYANGTNYNSTTTGVKPSSVQSANTSFTSKNNGPRSSKNNYASQHSADPHFSSGNRQRQDNLSFDFAQPTMNQSKRRS